MIILFYFDIEFVFSTAFIFFPGSFVKVSLLVILLHLQNIFLAYVTYEKKS